MTWGVRLFFLALLPLFTLIWLALVPACVLVRRKNRRVADGRY